MQDSYQEITVAITASALVLVFLASIIIIFIFQYQKKQLQHLEEINKMNLQFQQEILQAQLEIQEQTFTDISTEIHDNVGQVLSLVKVQLNIIEESTGITSNPIIIGAKENISRAMTDLRNIAHSMNGQFIQQEALEILIAKELDRFGKIFRIETSFTPSTHAIPQMPTQQKVIIYRIVQECLQNIAKHAEAKNVGILVEYSDPTLQLKIMDDGKGFDMNEYVKNPDSGIGLKNIEHRAAMFGGKVNINSSNKGTDIQLTLNIEA